MAEYGSFNPDELKRRLPELMKRYETFKTSNLKLDMARGIPCKQQLDLSNGLLDCLGPDDYKAADGTDCRNYGGLDSCRGLLGISEAREFFAKFMEASPEEVIVGGSSSLNMMYDTMMRLILFGAVPGQTPWGRLQDARFLFPCPGYDRHFAVCEQFGIGMTIIEMKSDGPDMDAVEKLAGSDESVKGIWCVPKYSNPEGITFSDEVVDRLASMKTKAADFRIFWDNAYTVHHLTDKPDRLKNIMEACRNAGNPDRVFVFGSTSKVSFPGAGVAAMASSAANIDRIRKQMASQTIGPDKLNQLRHVRFYRDMDGIEAHMRKHAAILKPKFDMVQDTLQKELGGTGLANWSKPNGGYFISFNTPDGCAKETVKLAAEAGIKLTGAGATFPYGKDPRNRNIRIAPTFPPIDELKKAIEVLCVCVQIAAANKY